ncbi:MAG: MerR family DNA-binding transcriptional regulator [Rubrobacter sp.]|nr:MerR family DNA-binding transcriptional regulator [Rubrobacter sp.]
MDGIVHIGEAARRLGVTPEHLRNLERSRRIPKPQRDYNGRVYSEFDLALLGALGVGYRPRKLKRAEDVLKAAR